MHIPSVSTRPTTSKRWGSADVKLMFAGAAIFATGLGVGAALGFVVTALAFATGAKEKAF